jgi:zinc transporter 1/2/3
LYVHFLSHTFDGSLQVTSLFGTLLPIFLRTSKHIPKPFFEYVHHVIIRFRANGRFAKYFGSGVIIATAFIHLLAPAFEALGSECLSGAWTDYSWAPAIAMAAVYAIFFAEVAAYRIGTKKLAKLGVNYSQSPSSTFGNMLNEQTHITRTTTMHTLMLILARNTSMVALRPRLPRLALHPHCRRRSMTSKMPAMMISRYDHRLKLLVSLSVLPFSNSVSFFTGMSSSCEAECMLIGSVIIGLTLAVNDEFITLFVVLIFHRMSVDSMTRARLMI